MKDRLPLFVKGFITEALRNVAVGFLGMVDYHRLFHYLAGVLVALLVHAGCVGVRVNLKHTDHHQ